MSLNPLVGRAFPGAVPGGAESGGVRRARVTRFDDGGNPYVELPRHTPGYEYGPVESLVSTLSLNVGDRVLVAFIENRVDDPVIIGRLGGVGGGASGGADEALIWMGD